MSVRSWDLWHYNVCCVCLCLWFEPYDDVFVSVFLMPAFFSVCVCVVFVSWELWHHFSFIMPRIFLLLLFLINHVSIRPAVGTIVLWKYLRESSFPHLWHGLTFQLLPVLHSIKTPQCAIRKEVDLTEHVLFLFHFNRKLFIQRINHKILQTSDFIMQPSSNYTQL